MTVLKRNFHRIKRKSFSEKQPEPKVTGTFVQGGKVVWVYKPVKLPYSPNNLDKKVIQEAVDKLPV